ncbi:MAG: hypothetical protein KJ799_16145 [Bacteroidetes bacterium]|nr:hypothetical protein [Bacteroidota bacterium]MBU2508230.1 hypothetical protein [Bacteroidota bacterium]
MKSVIKLLLSLFVMLLIHLLISCDTTGINDTDEVLIKTNANSYKINDSTRIELKIQNNLPNPVYYICSGDVFLDELKNNKIINSWKVNGFEECLAIRPITPQSEKFFYFSFQDDNSLMIQSGAIYTENVIYRFRVILFVDNEAEQSLEYSSTISNQFNILK